MIQTEHHGPMERLTSEEREAFTNLVTAAAVNKRLLMRIVAHLEQRPLEEVHDEVAALDAEFRASVSAGLKTASEQEGAVTANGPLPVHMDEHALAADHAPGHE
jgi:hypothetical protein